MVVPNPWPSLLWSSLTLSATIITWHSLFLSATVSLFFLWRQQSDWTKSLLYFILTKFCLHTLFLPKVSSWDSRKDINLWWKDTIQPVHLSSFVFNAKVRLSHWIIDIYNQCKVFKVMVRDLRCLQNPNDCIQVMSKGSSNSHCSMTSLNCCAFLLNFYILKFSAKYKSGIIFNSNIKLSPSFFIICKW